MPDTTPMHPARHALTAPRLAIATAAAIAVTLAASSASAQSTFNSANADNPAGADNNWNSAANWDTAAVPNGSSARAVVPQGLVQFNLRLQTFPITVHQLTLHNTAASALGITVNNGTGGSLTLAIDATDPSTPINPQIVNALGDSTQTADNIISAPLTLGGNLTVQQDHTFAQLNLTGAIDDGGNGLGITKSGAGVLQLGNTTQTNTYTGNTVINAGVLRIQSPTSLPGGLLAGSTTGSNLVLNGGVAGITAQAPLFSRDLGTGPGQVRFTGSGGFAGYGTGGRQVNLGGASATLVWGSTPNFLAAGQTLILGSTAANNAIEFQNSIDFNGAARTVNTPNGTGSTGDGKLSGTLSNGGLVKTGGGLLDLIGTTPNTYTSDTQINAGNLRLGKTPGVNAIAGNVTIGNNSGGNDILALLADDQINDTSVLAFKGAVGGTVGIFRLNDHVETVGGISSNANDGIIENNSANPATLTVANSADYSFGGQIRDGATSTGPLSIVKSGPGTLTLTGTNANTYTGSTTVRAGTLKLGAGASLGTGALVNIAGGTLDVSAALSELYFAPGQTLAGGGRLAGGATVQGGNIAPGDPTAPNPIGTLTAENVTLGGGSKLVIDFADRNAGPGVGWDRFTVEGTLTLGGDSSNPITIELVSRDAAGALGVPTDFHPLTSGSWVIASAPSTAGAAALIAGSVDPSQFVLDLSQWSGTTDASQWGVSVTGNEISLTYTAVPEPATLGGVVVAAGAALVRRRRRTS